MTTVATARSLFEPSTGRTNRISSRPRINHSWLPTTTRLDTSQNDIDVATVTGSINTTASNAKDDGPFYSSYSSLSPAARGRYGSEPRELNDDELLSADDDGDQLLVIGLPAVRHGYSQDRAQVNRSNDAVWKMLHEQQNETHPTPAMKQNQPEVPYVVNGVRDFQTTSGGNSWPNALLQSSGNASPVANTAATSRNASIDAWKQNGQVGLTYNPRDQRDQSSALPSSYAEYDVIGGNHVYRPLTVTTTSPAIDDSHLALSPASNGGLLSPSGSASGRRSALPVPKTRHTVVRSKLPLVDGDSRTHHNNGVLQRSPSITPPPSSMTSSPSWPANGSGFGSSLPTSANSRLSNGDSPHSRSSNSARTTSNGTPGSFVRGDLTRASMFERGSRKHIPASVNRGMPVHSARNGTTDRHSENHHRPRSTSPSSRNGLVVQSSKNSSQLLSPKSRDMATDRLHPNTIAASDVTSGSDGRRPRPSPISMSTSATDGWNGYALSSSVPPSPGFSRTPVSVHASPTSLANEYSTSKSKDADNDTSSGVLADTSLWDFRLTVTDVSDILANLSSAEWNERRDGLANLQNMFRTNACIAPNDLKRITDIFTRMFHDPQKKVFVVLVEVLADFFYVHGDDLGYWLPIVLPRLFVKIGANDLRGSVQSKLQRALDAARETFPSDIQLDTLANFMTDQAQLQSVKTKEAVLDYLHELVLNMDTADLVNTPTIRALLLRVVLWAAESQSSDVRKEAEAVVAAMFNVNSPEFALAMTSQPKGVQEMVDRILKNHMRTAHGINDPPPDRRARHHDNGVSQRAPVARQMVEHVQLQSPSQLQPQHRRVKSMPATERHDAIATPTSSRHKSIPTPSSVEKERVLSSVPSSRLTPVQGLTPPSRLQLPRTAVRRKPYLSVDSGVATGDEVRGQNGEDSSPEIMMSPRMVGIAERQRQQQHQLQEQRTPMRTTSSSTAVGSSSSSSSGNTGLNNSSVLTTVAAKKATSLEDYIREIPAEISINDNADDCSRWWTYIVGTLSDGTASRDGRRTAIRQLIDSLPNNPATISPSGVRSILAVLLSTAAASDEVSALANECAAMLLDSALHPVARCRLLGDLIQLGVQPINLAALQLLRTTLDTVADTDLAGLLAELVACLLRVYEDDDRNVRKAGVDVLVQVYVRVGEQIWLYVQSLSDAKANFLKTRFRRAIISRSTSVEEML